MLFKKIFLCNHISLFSDRGWVGWKNEKKEFVEIIFEFETIQEFYSIELYCNNQFTREISVFKELRAFFSIGGDIYSSDAVSYTPMTDEIFEEPRNITAKLHRRVGRYVKIQLYFSSKWLLISEVSFDSSNARGNYSVEVKEGEVRDAKVEQQQETIRKSEKVNTVKNSGEAASHMPVIVGALATVIILLAGIIFFIVSRARGRKLSAGGCPALPSEKVALNCNDTLQFSYDPLTLVGTGSDSGNSGSNGSRSDRSRKGPFIDNNFNSSVFGSPRSPRQVGGSRQGSLHASPVIKRSTPQSTPRLGATPKRRIINNPMAEGPLYMEPYQVMRSSPYVKYGPSGLSFSKETAILSDTSFGDYAVPMPAPASDSRTQPRKYSDSDTSLDQGSDYVFLQVSHIELSGGRSLTPYKKFPLSISL